MTNILEGVQFREPNAKFPHWNRTDEYARTETYGIWQDVPAGRVEFSAKTQFRSKPVLSFRVTTQGSTTTHQDKDAAMSFVAQSIHNGYDVSIVCMPSPTPTIIGPDRKLQCTDQKGAWHFVTISSTFTLDTNSTFRIRPDFYHTVDTHDPLIKGTVSFHDIEELAKYVDKRIRTDGVDFTVRKVKYV